MTLNHWQLYAALKHGWPDASWDLIGDDYEGMDWRGPGTMPTLAEVESKWDEIKDIKPRRRVPKSLIIERLTDEQVTAALGEMTDKQAERWRMPGKASVFADDPETIAVLQAIDADPEVILAP